MELIVDKLFFFSFNLKRILISNVFLCFERRLKAQWSKIFSEKCFNEIKGKKDKIRKETWF